MASKDNPAILKKYVLVPDSVKSPEYLVMLMPPINIGFVEGEVAQRTPQVVAVYEPTGRGPFKDEHGSVAWEYEYKGVRVQ